MSDIVCFYEPIRGPGKERRDGLGKLTYGDTGKKRPNPHLGEDLGFTNGSEGKPIYAVHAGTVTDVFDNGSLGWSMSIGIPDNCNCGFGAESIEYNHMLVKPSLKIGDKVVGNYQSQIGVIGNTGTAISVKTAFHLHMSMGPAKHPHTLPLNKKRAMFPLIDESSKNRKAAMEAKKA